MIYSLFFPLQMTSTAQCSVYSVSPENGKMENEVKAKTTCKYCKVDIPPGEESKELHESGKRHVRMRAQFEAIEALSRRSVFIKVAPMAAVSLMETEDGEGTEGNRTTSPTLPLKVRLERAEVESVFAQFGPIERVLCRSESGHFAIVEFAQEESAGKAISCGKVQIKCQFGEESGEQEMMTAIISERRVNFSAHPVEKTKIDVDEIVDSLSSLSVHPNGDVYSTAADEVIRRIVLTPQQLVDRQGYAARLEKELSRYFVAPSVQVFGSSITSIGTIDSDIDMCLLLGSPLHSHAKLVFLHEQQMRDKYSLLTREASLFKAKKVQAGEVRRLGAPDRVRLVSKILNELRKECGWIGVQRPIIDCRLPIVRFILDKQIIVDLSVDNSIGVAKSAYIKEIIKSDSSCNMRRFLISLRFWALSNGLFEPHEKEHKGHFNAYMLNLMAISHLQATANVPPFQHSQTLEYGGSGGRWRIDFTVPQYSLQQYNVKSFLKSFFVQLTSGVNLRETVILGGTGELVPLSNFSSRFPELIEERKGTTKFEFGLVNVQDPIECNHNVTSTLSDGSVRRMRHMMMRSLHIMKKEDNFASFLCIEKRLNERGTMRTLDSGNVSVEMNEEIENGQYRMSTAIEETKADAVIGVPYPRERPTTMGSMMKAVQVVLEKVLVSEEVDEGREGGNAIKRRKVLSTEIRDKMDKIVSPSSLNARNHPLINTTLCSSSNPPMLLFHWGIISIPARLWIGRRNVKRRLSKEQPQSDEMELDNIVSHELLCTPCAIGGEFSSISSDDHPSVLLLHLQFAFHSDTMIVRFHLLEGASLDLSNAVHFLDGNGLLAKYVHALLPTIEVHAMQSTQNITRGQNGQNRILASGKRQHEDDDAMETE